MSRVIAFVACGFILAACSASIPSLDFLKSSPRTAALQFESVPPGAEVKAAGQTCRTPCELTLEVGEVSASFALKGYEPQTVLVESAETGALSAPRFAQNPVHVDLRRVVASARKHAKPKTVAAAANPTAPISAGSPESSSAPETTPSH